MHPDWYRYHSHCVVKGATQQGKSKLIEDCARQHINRSMGFTILDWHGTLCASVLSYLKYIQPRHQRVVVIDPSAPDFVVPWNPFALPEGHEISAHVSRLVNVMAKMFGSANTNEMPTFERRAKMLIYAAAASGEPLQHAAKLLRFPAKHLRDRAIERMADGDIRDEWEELNAISNFRDWKAETLSTANRISRFLFAKGIARTIGLKGQSLDISKAIGDGAVILVNLRRSAYLDSESARLFAALLLDEFLNVAVQNSDRRRPYWLACDEAQEYVTDDAGHLLDQAMKSGLRCTFVHHNDSQFADRPKVLGAMEMNARIKCLFAGLPVHEVKRHAEEFWFREVNRVMEKLVLYSHQTTGHREVPFRHITTSATASGGRQVSASRQVSEAEALSETSTSSRGDDFGYSDIGEGGFNWGERVASATGSGRTLTRGGADTNGTTEVTGFAEMSGTVTGTRTEPLIERLVSGVQHFTLEEKVSMLAERITSLRPREYVLRLPDGTRTTAVPTLRDYLISPAYAVEFEETLTRGSIPAAEVDRRIADQKKEFLGETNHDTDKRTKAKRKAVRPLSPQN